MYSKIASHQFVEPTDRTTARPVDLSTQLSCVFLVAAAAISCGLFFYFVGKTAIRVPVYDMLDWLQFYDDRVRANDWLWYLWAPHNEHRIVFTRALIAIDIRWLGGNGTAFAILDTLLWGLALLAVWQIVFTSSRSQTFKIFSCSIVLLLLTPTYIVTTISMPGPGAFMQTPSFALFSFVLLDNETDNAPLRMFYRGCALFCACLSPFGVSAGLLVWPVLIWLSWRAGMSKRWIASIIGTGLTSVTLYLWKMPPKGYQSPLDIQRLIGSIDYGIRFLGLPWSHSEALTWPARVVGVFILVVGVLVIIKSSFKSENLKRAQRIGAALILFAFLAAAAAAFGRVNIPGPTPIRYATFMLLAHLGLFLYVLPHLCVLWDGGRARSLQWGAVVLAIAWLGHQVVVGDFAIREANHYNDAWSRFVEGEWTPDMFHYVYPNREQAITGLQYLRDHHVGWTLTPNPN